MSAPFAGTCYEIHRVDYGRDSKYFSVGVLRESEALISYSVEQCTCYAASQVANII